MNRIKSDVLHIRISPELKKAIEIEAEKDGRTISNYVLQLVRKDIESKKESK